MRICYLAVIAVILLVVFNTPDAQSVTNAEVDAASIAAEKADQAWREADIRREKAEKISAKQYAASMKAEAEYVEAVKALEKTKTKGDEAARLAAEKAEREASLRRDKASEEYARAERILNVAEFEALEREQEAMMAKDSQRDIIRERRREEEAAQKKAVKEEYAKAREAWKKADANVMERRKKEMRVCQMKARKEIFAGYTPERIEQENMLRQYGHGTIEFAILQNAYTHAVAKCHEKVEKALPRPQAPSYLEIEKRHQFGLRLGHDLEE